jgi:hypothetical protein
MIVYDLECGDGHRFEGWFASKNDFVAQSERGLVSCPTCGVPRVRRVPSVTRFNSGAIEPQEKKVAPAPPAEFAGKDPVAVAQILYSRFVDEMLQKSEDVGRAFPAEARRIHNQEAPARSIRGQATDEEHAELLDEGIAVLRLPVPPRDLMN